MTNFNKVTKMGMVLFAGLGIAGAAQAAIPGTYIGLGAGTQWNAYVAGELFAGHNFNQYIGVEANLHVAVAEDSGSSSSSDRISMLNLVAKAYLPIGDAAFNFYAMGGGAELFSTANPRHQLLPIVGAGVTYDINSNVTAGFEFGHIISRNVDTAMLTLAYNFG